MLKKMTFVIFTCLLMVFLIIAISGPILTIVGTLPVLDETPLQADAVIVLYTGVEYYPRLIEAARIYTAGFAESVVINGNRKSDVLRGIEKDGFTPNCGWAEDYIRILELYGVPRSDIIAVSAEDAFDTISEARIVGAAMLARNMQRIILTTSKFHTRRAKHIWKSLFKDRLTISSISAKTDPYSPDAWWKSGRQIRWVMAEYGAWVFYWWQTLTEKLFA